jgi:hypothetical protein
MVDNENKINVNSDDNITPNIKIKEEEKIVITDDLKNIDNNT